MSLFLLSNVWFRLGKVHVELNIWEEEEGIFHCSEEKNSQNLFQCRKMVLVRVPNLRISFFCNLHYYGKLGFPKTFNVIKNDTVI